MTRLDARQVRNYFARPGTVSQWWHPEDGPLHFHYEAELQVIRDCVAVDPRWRVLDVGTGRGRFGGYFAQAGCRVLGIDLNPEMLAAARETAGRLGIADRFEVRLGSAEDLSGLGAGAFDIALCMELFDHLPDLVRVLAEIRRTLSAEGRLLFTYVPSESLYGAVGNLYRWVRGRTGDAGALLSRTYSFAEITAALAQQGLTLERYWGVGLLCLSAQTRLFQRNPLVRLFTALARAEARRYPYHQGSALARRAAHVVGLARVTP
jgi:2-polyprenyl-6-hydroxyphenyl methylase/3-demethylubiquinone-9 3-methyltransferase